MKRYRHLGESVSEVAQGMVALANESQHVVTCKFNEVSLRVEPGEKPNDVERRYWEKIKDYAIKDMTACLVVDHSAAHLPMAQIIYYEIKGRLEEYKVGLNWLFTADQVADYDDRLYQAKGLSCVVRLLPGTATSEDVMIARREIRKAFGRRAGICWVIHSGRQLGFRRDERVVSPGQHTLSEVISCLLEYRQDGAFKSRIRRA